MDEPKETLGQGLSLPPNYEHLRADLEKQLTPLPGTRAEDLVERDPKPEDEDYVLAKRKLLMEAGFPRQALLITVVRDKKGEGHAVLTVRTDKGDFILDNKRNAVLPWRQTGYTFIKREGTSGKAWVAFGDQAAPTVTANRLAAFNRVIEKSKPKGSSDELRCEYAQASPTR